jgi:hypothetical protein
MKKHFATYNQSLALKESGFDEPCIMYIDDEEDLINDDTAEWIRAVKCPLKSQVFEWFRKNHKLRHNVMDFIDDITGIEWDYEIATIGTDLDESGNYIPLIDYSIDDETRKFKTYEEAESACIDKLIEIIKKK